MKKYCVLNENLLWSIYFYIGLGVCALRISSPTFLKKMSLSLFAHLPPLLIHTQILPHLPSPLPPSVSPYSLCGSLITPYLTHLLPTLHPSTLLLQTQHVRPAAGCRDREEVLQHM